jgi:hypothetical protein
VIRDKNHPLYSNPVGPNVPGSGRPPSLGAGPSADLAAGPVLGSSYDERPARHW